jgi:diguanylate cyclase (GGDEF)-like protein
LHRLAPLWLSTLLGLYLAVAFVSDANAGVQDRLDACEQAEDREPSAAIIHADAVLDDVDQLTPVQHAAALGCRGWSRAVSGKHEAAIADAHALASVASSLPSGGDRVRFIRRAGSTLHRAGDRVGAIEYYARAAVAAEAAALDPERIPLLVNLGVLHSEFEEHDRAQVNYDHALALIERYGDLHYEAPTRFNLGVSLNGQGRHSDATPHLQRALTLVRENTSTPPSYVLAVQVALAKSLMGAGRRQDASKLLADIARADTNGLDASMRWSVVGLNVEYQDMLGNPKAALALLGSNPSEMLPDMQKVGWFSKRAELLEKLGRPGEAVAMLRQASDLRERHLLHLNHERLAALDSHMRNRQQQLELERLQLEATTNEARLLHGRRMQWAVALVALLFLSAGIAVALWQRRVNRLLLAASHTDPLTGLANRRKMGLRLTEICSGGEPGHALFLVDIDHFKRVNDVHGHDVGDEVLVACARRLQDFAGGAGMVARWGGEEFLLLLPVNDAAQAGRVAGELGELLARPIATRIGAVCTTVSTGVANLPLAGPPRPEGWHYTVQTADSALYSAKGNGRDGWVCLWGMLDFPEWPPERVARETALAFSLGVIDRYASRQEADTPSNAAAEGSPQSVT